jgi:type II restriction enzyme
MATKGALRTIASLVADALTIIGAFGIPLDGLTPRRRERMAKAFLAVGAMKPGNPWSTVRCNEDGHRLRSREILKWWNDYLGEALADSSYDDIRDDLEMIVLAGIVLNAANRPNAKTNDGTRAYALNPWFATAIRVYGTDAWERHVIQAMADREMLSAKLDRTRAIARIPLVIREKHFSLSPGKHNVVQKAVVEKFLPRFGFGAEVLYLGDTEKKNLYHDAVALNALGFFELAHDKLPDVVAYSESRNWLFLIEAVDSANPIDELRRAKFLDLTKDCKPAIVFVTAFPDRVTFRKFAKDIAWETEVWIADNPDHMIHFNGDKFLGPYTN